MSIDLERSLDDLARSVRDDDLAERLNGQVHRMVAQVRRRRAARYTTNGVVGMGAAAAVVIAGMQLAGSDEGAAPAGTQQPAPDGAWPACGSPSVPSPSDAPDATFVLTGTVGPTVPYGTDVPLSLTLMSANAQTFEVDPTVQLVVLGDGVVVGTAEGDAATLGVVDGVDPAADAAVTVVACGGDTPLGDGDYTMVATVTVTLDDGSVRAVVTEPLPFTIDGDPLDEREEEAAAMAARDLEAKLMAIIAASDQLSADGSFGVCGSVVPQTADASLTLELTLDGSAYRSGESFTTQIGVRATTAFPAGAQLTANNPQVVLTRGDVVVAVGQPTSPDGTVNPVPIDLEADGTGTVAATAWFALCSLPDSNSAELDLPAGTYQAYAVLTLTVDVTEVDGAQNVPWEPVVIRSEPVDVTLG